MHAERLERALPLLPVALEPSQESDKARVPSQPIELGIPSEQRITREAVVRRVVQEADRQWIDAGAELITTNLVFAEIQILAMRARGPDEGLRFFDSVYQDPTHHVVFVTRELERAAVDHWIGRYRDKRLSLADVVSLEVMRSRRIRQALSLGEHFELAGFELVP